MKNWRVVCENILSGNNSYKTNEMKLTYERQIYIIICIFMLNRNRAANAISQSKTKDKKKLNKYWDSV